VTDPPVVLRKLGTLREHVARASRRRPSSVDAFLADVDAQDALSMSLLVAVQEAVDVAFHVSTDEGWGVPASYAESFEILARNGVLTDRLAKTMTSTSALRNRLAHGYASVDAARLWAELPAGLEALTDFATRVAVWLGRSASP